MALRNLGADFERYRVVEFDKYAIASYNAVHGTDFPTMDICDVHGKDLGIVDKDKYEYIMFYSYPCFTGDTLVLTREHGYKPIKDVQIGEYVLSHDNLYHRVLRSEMTGHKTVYRIKGMGIHELRCTSNHRFYVRKRTKYYPTYENGKRGNCRRFEKPEWKPLSEIDKNYYLGVAINQKSIMPDFIDEELRNNHSFWYIVGRYVGDGWTDEYGTFICGNERKIAELITHIDCCGFQYSKSQERTCIRIRIASKELHDVCEMFGKGCSNKFIPSFMFDMPIEYLRNFILGYFCSDGSYQGNRYHIASINGKLIYGTAQLIAKVYKQPYSIYKQKRKTKVVIEGRTCNQQDSWEVVWKPDERKQDNAFYEEGYVWFPIQSIEECEDQEDVYDLTVEDSHSFTANGVIVHNCTDLSIAGKMLGMEKGSGTRSALIWECERILNELNELGNLPDVLCLENVPAIHSEQNRPSFQKWLDFLETLGYSNFVQDLNASDYGIAQNRDRTFVVSILGEWNYHFPEPIELTTCIEDYFEDLTDEQALQLVVKSEKALNLLRELDDDGKLE